MTMWNPADASADISVGSEGLVLTRLSSNDGSWRGVRSLTAKSSGKWYAEFENLQNASSNGGMVGGVATSAYSLTSQVGGNSASWGVQANNTSNLAAYHNNSLTVLVSGGSASISPGERMMVAVDFDAGKIWFGTKGEWRNGNPSAGAGANYSFTPNTPLYLAVSLQRTPQVVGGVLPADHAFDVPAGFQPWIAPDLRFYGTVTDAAGDPAARDILAIREVDDSIAGQAVSDGVTGEYELFVYHDEPHTLVFSGEAGRNALVFSGVVPE